MTARAVTIFNTNCTSKLCHWTGRHHITSGHTACVQWELMAQKNCMPSGPPGYIAFHSAP